MNASLASPQIGTPIARPVLLAWGAACAVVLVVAVAGVVGTQPLPTFGWAAVFLAAAVGFDLRFRKIPNLLTFPALLLALAFSPQFGATAGFGEAFAGAGLGFVLLVVPYALGGMGAGDVKALMALGAWLGPTQTVHSAILALLLGALVAIFWLVARGELRSYAKRWGRILLLSFAGRRFDYEPPASDSAAARGLPFAVPLAAGVAVTFAGGLLW